MPDVRVVAVVPAEAGSEDVMGATALGAAEGHLGGDIGIHPLRPVSG